MVDKCLLANQVSLSDENVMSGNSSLPDISPFLIYFRQLRKQQEKFLNFLFLKNNQPKLILMPQRHIFLLVNFAPIYTLSKYSFTKYFCRTQTVRIVFLSFDGLLCCLAT